jgi:hypothetical protein
MTSEGRLCPKAQHRRTRVDMNPQVALRNEHLGAEQSVPNDNTILHNFYKTKSQLAFPKQNKKLFF